MKTRTISLQFAFFLSDIVSRPDLEFNDLNSKMLNIFDGMPQIIPIPQELPTEVPVMVLRSENKEYACNIARSRIDFIVQRTSDIKSNSDLLTDFKSKILGLTKVIQEKQKISRFGLVARYFIQDNTANRTIRNRFFTPAVDGSQELSLRQNKPSEMYGFNMNDIIEISSASALTNGISEKGISILRDINNNPIHNKDLDYQTISGLLDKYFSRISESEVMGLVK
ncbi:hypothetical protein ACVBIL_05705 [Shewanella sp. 125m-7]